MLWKSKLSRAPSSERSSASFNRPSRWVRSRSTSTRSSQSTAFGPYVRMPMALSLAERQVFLNIGMASEDAPDGVDRIGTVVAEPVGGGRREADRVPRAQLVGVEADVDPQPARQQVAELLAGVAHEGALPRGAGARLVLDAQELHPRERPGREAAPLHPRLQLQGLVLAPALEGEEPLLTSADRHRRDLAAGQQPVDGDPEQVDDVEQLADRRLGLAGLDLGQGAGANPQPPGHLTQPDPLAEPLGPQPAPQVEGGSGGRLGAAGPALRDGRHVSSVPSEPYCSPSLDKRYAPARHGLLQRGGQPWPTGSCCVAAPS